jgi:hypothetical protein
VITVTIRREGGAGSQVDVDSGDDSDDEDILISWARPTPEEAQAAVSSHAIQLLLVPLLPVSRSCL